MNKLRAYDVIRNPVVTEKSTMASEHGQVVFDVAIDATKPEIKAGRRGAVLGQGQGRQHLVRKGKVKRFRGHLGRPQRRQEGDRHPRRRPVDRHDDRHLGEAEQMGLKTYNPTTPGRRQLVTSTAPSCGRASRSRPLTEG
jgi:large subunit ribosomal protein L23